MIKIQIKTVFGRVLFEYEKKDNTVKDTLVAAVEKRADLKRADLKGAYLEGADLEGADLKGAYLEGAYLKGAYLEGAYLKGAYLEGADLRGAYLEGAKNFIASQVDFFSGFEKVSDGIIVYKSFSETYESPNTWIIEKGSVISEFIDSRRGATCSFGINAATLDWCKRNCLKPIWKCLIRWEWLPGVVVPYGSDGKFRTERLELIEIVERIN